ncbi:MAG: biotin-dependent carboxyltransferase family protein [Desulfobacteraceae bacterium]
MAAVKVLQILAPGPLTTLQDLGRTGYGAFGVPPSGAVDAFSLRIGNLLVGNPDHTAGLEITLMGLRAKVLSEMVVAVTGGDMQPLHNGRPLPMWEAALLNPGDALSFQVAKTGCRSYLTVGGGFAAPKIMGSAATNLSTGFGGLDGRALKKGDLLASHSPHAHLGCAGNRLHRAMVPVYADNWRLRVIWGPQEPDFPQAAKTRFLKHAFTVTSESDRTGIRLKGPLLPAKEGLPTSIISEGVVPGAIQVPGSGQPIILLGETVTGGYRKIATVISADLPWLGQIRPDQGVKFEAVTLSEAQKALQKREDTLSRLREQIGSHPICTQGTAP